MKKILFILFLITSSSSLLFSQASNTSTGYANASIQDVLNNAGTASGHTILVYPGIYNEDISIPGLSSIKIIAKDWIDNINNTTTIISSGIYGFEFAPSGSGRIEGFTISNNSSYGVHLGGSCYSGIYIVNNIIKNNGNGYRSDWGCINDIYILSNIFMNNATGIYFSDGGTSGNIKIINNSIHNNTGYGINARNMRILAFSNNIYSNSINIHFENNRNSVISSNHIWNATGNAMYINRYMSNLTVINNLIENNNNLFLGMNPSPSGAGPMMDWIFSNNTIRNCSSVLSFSLSATNITFTHNQCYSNQSIITTSVLKSIINLKIKNNIIYHNTADLFSSNLSGSVVFSNNTFASNNSRILYLTSTPPKNSTSSSFVVNNRFLSNGNSASVPAIEAAGSVTNLLIKDNSFSFNYQDINTHTFDINISKNNFLNSINTSFLNSQAGQINATNNWWGSTISNNFSTEYSGAVTVSPYRLGPVSDTAGHDTTSFPIITGLNATSLGLNKIRLTWNPVTGNDFAEYRIYVTNINNPALLNKDNIRSRTNVRTAGTNSISLGNYTGSTVYLWITAADNPGHIYTNETFFSSGVSGYIDPNDLSPPLLSATITPSANTWNRGTVILSGSMDEEEDAGGISSVTWGTNGIIVGTVDYYESSQGTGRIWTNVLNTAILPDGTNSIRIMAANSGGFTNTNDYQILIDNTAPIILSNTYNIVVDALFSNLNIYYRDSSTSFTNGNLYAFVSLSNNYHMSNQVLINTSNDYYNIKISNFNFSYSNTNIAVWLRDFAGNVSGTNFFYITNFSSDTDNTEPFPSSNLGFVPSAEWHHGTIWIQGNVKEYESILEISNIYLNDNLWTNINVYAGTSNIYWSNQLNTSNAFLSNGLNYIRLNYANNTTAPQESTNIYYSLYIDNETPDISPVFNTLITNGLINIINFNPTETISGIQNIYIGLSNIDYTNNASNNFGLSPGIVPFTGSIMTNVGVAGFISTTTNIVIWAVDKAGNISTCKFFTLTNADNDNTEPIPNPVLVYPTNHQPGQLTTNWLNGYNNTNIILMGYVEEDLSSVGGLINIEGIDYANLNVFGSSSPYTFSNIINLYDSSISGAVSSGANTFTITFWNNGANKETTNYAYTIYIDETKPSKVIVLYNYANNYLTNFYINWYADEQTLGDSHSRIKGWIVTNYTTGEGNFITSGTTYNFTKNISYNSSYVVGVAGVDNAGIVGDFSEKITCVTKADSTAPSLILTYNNQTITSTNTNLFVNNDYPYLFTISEDAAIIPSNQLMIINGITNSNTIFTGSPSIKSYSLYPTNLGTGRHTVELYCSNIIGSNSAFTNILGVDLENPVITNLGPDSDILYSNILVTVLSVTDTYNNSIGYWKTNTSQYKPFTNRIEIQLLNGTNQIDFYAVDSVNNTSSVTTVTYKIVSPKYKTPEGISSYMKTYFDSANSKEIIASLEKYTQRSDGLAILNSIAEITKKNNATATPVVNLNYEKVLIFLRPDCLNPDKAVKEIKIYNRRSQWITTISAKDIGNELIAIWDKNDNNKKLVKNGLYILEISYKDGITHRIPHVIYE